MNNSQKTCDPERIELFLGQKLSDEEQTAFELHLDDCHDCRHRLEAGAAGDDVWSGVRDSLLGEQLPPDRLRPGDSALDSATGGDASFSHDTVLKLLAPTDDDRMLGRLGTYEVVGVVGSGGMGVVLKAFDGALNRYVAIKVLAPHLGSSGAARKRFSREAQAAAAVVHDNVTEIHAVADLDGLPYLVMPYVRGPSLQRRLDCEGPLAPVEILRIAVQAATGLAAAHSQGLVHRDVKPANILLADGVERVKLTDFGLARAADDASLTKTGIIAGTPQYMSPEQARGESVDQRSDLFSLGSVLYAMCTGRAPFRAETSYGVLRRITDEEPRPIRQLNPDVPQWLCRIIARLMSKQPDDRFESAREVAELLEECLAHVQQPTAVPLPASLVTQSNGSRFFSISRRSLGVIAMIAAFGFSLLGMVLWQATTPPDIAGKWTGEEWGTVLLEAKQPGQYEGSYTDSDKGKSGTVHLSWSRIERRFNGTWQEGDDRNGKISLRLVGDEIRGAWTTSKKSGIKPGTPELADLLWVRRGSEAPNHRRDIKKRGQIKIIQIHVVDENNKPIENATVFRNHVYAPRGPQRFKIENARFNTDASGTTAINLSGMPQDLRLWVTKNGFVPLHAMWAVQFQSDGDAIPDDFTFVMKRGTEIGGVVVDEMGRPIPEVGIEVRDMTVDNSVNPKRPPGNRPIRAYMLADGNAVVTDSQGRWALNNVPSDEVLLAGRSNKSSAGDFGKPLRPKQLLQLRFIHPRYAENEWGSLQLKHDVTLDSLRTKTAKVVLESKKETEETKVQETEVPGTVDSPKTTIAMPKRVDHFTALTTGSRVKIACSADGKLIAIANGGPTMILYQGGISRVKDNWKPSVQILDAETGKAVVSLALTTNDEDALLAATERVSHFEVKALAFSPDGSVVAVGTSIGQVKLFNARTGELVRSLDDEQAKLADKRTPEKWNLLARAMGSVESLAFSPDGSLLAICGDSFSDFSGVFGGGGRLSRRSTAPGRLKVWEVKTGTLKHDLVGHTVAWAVSFSPDGNLLASAGSWGGNANNGTGVNIWNPHTGRHIRTLGPHTNGGTRSVAFSPDSKLVVIGSGQFDSDKLFDKDKRKDAISDAVSLVHVSSRIIDWMITVPGRAKPVAFSPDGKSIAVLCGGRSIRFIETETGKVKHEIRPADSPQGGRWNDFAIAPQGHMLAIGGVDGERRGSVEVWDFDGPGTAATSAPVKDGEN